MFDSHLDLLSRVGLTSPAVHLGPTGYAGFNPVTGDGKSGAGEAGDGVDRRRIEFVMTEPEFAAGAGDAQGADEV